MPHYGLEDKEIKSLVTLIMGLVKDEIPPSKLPEKTPQFLAVSTVSYTHLTLPTILLV